MSGILDAPGGHTEENVYISPYIEEMMTYLDDCLDKLDDGRENEILSDPFFDSGLSDAQVDKLIQVIDDDCRNELGSFFNYHRNRQNCNAPPDYNRMGPAARRAMAEGALMILRRHQSDVTS